jgi:hypothetical protein
MDSDKSEVKINEELLKEKIKFIVEKEEEKIDFEDSNLIKSVTEYIKNQAQGNIKFSFLDLKFAHGNSIYKDRSLINEIKFLRVVENQGAIRKFFKLNQRKIVFDANRNIPPWLTCTVFEDQITLFGTPSPKDSGNYVLQICDYYGFILIEQPIFISQKQEN